MPHVSSNKLDKKVREKLFSELSRYIAKTNQSNSSSVLQTLLTPTEQTMLAKRIAVIALFHSGYSTYRVRKILSMSSSTVIFMHKQYKNDDYASVIKLFGKNKKDKQKLLNTLGLVLSCGMPSRVGMDRYRVLNSLYLLDK